MNKMVIPFFLLFFTGIVVGQTPRENEHGFPFAKNFTATDYRAHAQNFAIVRDSNGIVYAGNFAGVLQYDGEFWRLIPTEKTTKVSALGVDGNGTVFVGALGEIGQLVSNPRGELYYKSLINSTKVPAFQEVLGIFPTQDGVYFITKKLVLKWKNGQLVNWQPEYEILSGFMVYQTLYLQVKDMGLVTFTNGRLSRVAQSEMVTGAIEIKAMLTIDNQNFLLPERRGYTWSIQTVSENLTIRRMICLWKASSQPVLH